MLAVYSFFEQLKAIGSPVEAEFFPDAEHALPLAGARAISFLQRTLEPHAQP